MKWFRNLFKKKSTSPEEAVPLTIEGVEPAPMTPEPDDAELAAQAILETLASDSRVSSFLQSGVQTLCASGRADYKSKVSRKKKKTPETRNQKPETGEANSADHFRELAKKIRQAHEQSRQRTLRFICYCEQELQKPDLPEVGKGSLSLLEAELYKRIDTVEREGGDLKRRWQHCLAEVMVRRMGLDNG